MSKYTAKDIEVLEPLEGVRARPTMYIGSIDGFGILQIIKEIIDNSIDEHLSGFCNFIKIKVNKDSIIVEDNGRGIPVEKHPKHPDKSTLEIIFTMLHAGGKLKDTGVYSKGSRGTFGIGSAATNALCSKLIVRTFRNKWYEQIYEKGIPITKVKKVKF